MVVYAHCVENEGRIGQETDLKLKSRKKWKKMVFIFKVTVSATPADSVLPLYLRFLVASCPSSLLHLFVPFEVLVCSNYREVHRPVFHITCLCSPPNAFTQGYAKQVHGVASRPTFREEIDLCCSGCLSLMLTTLCSHNAMASPLSFFQTASF